jgi:hypothetical protein
MRKLVFAAILLTMILFGWTVWYDRSLREEDPHGYRNLKACAELRPGVTEEDLVRVMGPPERREEAQGVRRLAFHTLRAAAAPISAEVDPATGRVLLLRCRDDEKPTWVAP